MASTGKRAYGRLTLFERRAIEEALSKRHSIRQIAEALGRAPSTVANEIKTNRTVLRGGERGNPIEALPEKACAKLMKSPGVCNPCKYYRHPCGYKLKVEYLGTRADHLCDARKRQARTGADRSEASMSMALSVIRSDISRGLSPAQIARARKDELKVSASTVYRWISRGYCGMSDLELRRKVGYKPRRKVTEPKPTAHGKDRCYETFVALGIEQCEGAAEMDTVIGTKFDTQCILTLYLRPSRFQFMFLLAQKTSSAVAAALDSLERICTADVFQTAFGLVLTDNGSEFSDTKALERSVLKDCPRTKVYYCDVRQSQQKARCERAHVELRKLLPKNQGIQFDLLNKRDMACLMSHVNSSPRPSLGGLSPIDLLGMQYPTMASTLLEAYGIEKIPYEKLNLTAQSINRRRRHDGEDLLAFG